MTFQSIPRSKKSTTVSTALRCIWQGVALYFLFTLPSKAQDVFKCEVTAMQAVGDRGEVVDNLEHFKKQVGSRFTVDKATGAIKGGYFINNDNSEKTVVTNDPRSNSFYVVNTSYGPIRMVGYLYIGNHRKSLTKPFVYTSSGEYIYLGYCV